MKTIDRALIAVVATGIVGIQLIQLSTSKSIESSIATTREAVGVLSNEVAVVKKDIKALEAAVVYKSKEKLSVSTKELQCLAKNIFHEAGIEGRAGKVAVAQVTLNRLKSQRWGNNLCSVVYAKAQFSWTLNKKQVVSQPKGKLWDDSVDVANQFVRGYRVKGLESSGFYHTDYIKPPKWSKGKTVALVVGQHIFYDGVDG